LNGLVGLVLTTGEEVGWRGYMLLPLSRSLSADLPIARRVLVHWRRRDRLSEVGQSCGGA
jgi:hypothetical protein